MTKAEIRELAKDVTLMDKLNTISGLIEANQEENKEIIDDLIDDIFKGIKDKEIIALPKSSKKWYLNQIKAVDPELYEKLKNERLGNIRLHYDMMTNENK